MALRWADSCGDFYNHTHLHERWNAVAVSPTSSQSLTRTSAGIGVVLGAGRCGGDAIAYVGQVIGPTTMGLWKTLDSRNYWVVGWAYRPSTPTVVTRDALLTLQQFGEVQLSVTLEENGRLSVRRGLSTSLGTSSLALLGGNWYYLEFRATIHDSAGSFTLRVNGSTVLTASGIDTQNVTGVATADTFKFSGIREPFGGELHGGPDLIDDIVIIDNQASLGLENGRLTDFVGDVQVLIPAFADANGALQDFTPNAGVNHFDRINEHPPDDDTTYLEETTSGSQETNEYSDISTAFTIIGYNIVSRVNKQQAGDRSFRHIIRESVGPTVHQFNDIYFPSVLDYYYFDGPSDRNPFTAAQYTAAEVNALQYGIRVQS